MNLSADLEALRAEPFKAQDLTEGDLIDLEVIFAEVGGDEDLDSDIHEYELATVEGVSIEGDEVLILTDQHSVMVPINFIISAVR